MNSPHSDLHVPQGRTLCPFCTPRECRMDGVLPPRGVERDLPVPGRLRLAPGSSLDTSQASRDHPEGIPPPLLRRRMAAQGPGTGAVPGRTGHHHPVSLPGIGDPLPLAAGSGMRTRKRPTGTCGEPVAGTTRTAGSGDGPVIGKGPAFGGHLASGLPVLKDARTTTLACSRPRFATVVTG